MEEKSRTAGKFTWEQKEELQAIGVEAYGQKYGYSLRGTPALVRSLKKHEAFKLKLSRSAAPTDQDPTLQPGQVERAVSLPVEQPAVHVNGSLLDLIQAASDCMAANARILAAARKILGVERSP